MKIEYNFVSLVAIGNFNPAIATPKFMGDVCGMAPEKIRQRSPDPIPVLKQLEFENFRFEVHLERLALEELSPKDVYEGKVVHFFKKYYDKLSYTPLKVVGININCNISFDDENTWKKAKGKVNDYKLYLEFFSSNEVDVATNYLATTEKVIPREARFKVEHQDGITRQINAHIIATESLTINYNWEVRGLDNNIDKLRSLLKRYSDFCKEYFEFIHELRG